MIQYLKDLRKNCPSKRLATNGPMTGRTSIIIYSHFLRESNMKLCFKIKSFFLRSNKYINIQYTDISINKNTIGEFVKWHLDYGVING